MGTNTEMAKSNQILSSYVLTAAAKNILAIATNRYNNIHNFKNINKKNML